MIVTPLFTADKLAEIAVALMPVKARAIMAHCQQSENGFCKMLAETLDNALNTPYCR